MSELNGSKLCFQSTGSWQGYGFCHTISLLKFCDTDTSDSDTVPNNKTWFWLWIYWPKPVVNMCGLMVILQCRKVAAIPQKTTLKPTKKQQEQQQQKNLKPQKNTLKLRICEENYLMSCNIQQQIWCSFHWFVNTSQMPKLTSYLCDFQTADCMFIVCWFFVSVAHCQLVYK